MAVGALNTVLLLVLLRRSHGLLAGVVASALYATWGVTAGPERTILLEPLLNLSVLTALLCLTPRPSGRARAFTAGVLLGFGIVIKLLLVPVAILIFAWVWRSRGGAAAGRFAGGAALAATAVAGPFFVLSPVNMWEQIVLDQVGRGRGTGVVARLAVFAADTGHVVERLGERPVAIMVVALIGALLAGGVCARSFLWVGLAVLNLALVLSSPSFYDHYAATPALPLCALLGISVSWLLAQIPRRAAPVVLAPLGVFMLALLTYNLTGPVFALEVERREVIEFGEAHRCVWTNFPTAALLANSERRRLEEPCAQELDHVGHILDLTRDESISNPHEAAPHLADWQSRVRQELQRSDGAIMVGPPESQPWDEATQNLFTARFEQLDADAGGVSLWTLR